MSSLEEIKKEYKELSEQLRDPEIVSDWKRTEELSKRKSSLEPIIQASQNLEKIDREIKENEEILKTGIEDELTIIAEEELKTLKQEKETAEKTLKKILSRDEDIEENELIMEIRAGAGGDEASLFVGDLFRMYSRYAQNNNWNLTVVDSHQNEEGGYKQISFELKGIESYQKLKNEAGVHRVQRIPTTEKMGRIHTSTVSVAVLPKPKETAITIRPDDLKIDVFRASGPGGQNVNKRETAIRITHLPTGLVVACQTERNQLQNKESALNILRAKLLENKREEEARKFSESRKEQIGSAKRSEKIRTYNFPQDRITDHRIQENWHGIEKRLDGDIEDIIQSLLNAEELN